MRYTISLFYLCIPILLFSQTDYSYSSKFKLGFELGKFIPQNENFRENYDQEFLKTPISNVGFLGCYSNKPRIDYYFELQLIQNNFEWDENINLFMIPMNFGLKYYFYYETDENKIIPFVGVGTGYVLSLLTINSYKIYDELGNATEDDYMRKYHGLNILMSAGIEYITYLGTETGLKIDYCYTYSGDVENGALGNVGGLTIQLYVTWDIKL